ncbi:PREDICTED: LOB domain-containing protein 3-like [Tarenaya hassleriana]|uniref:LOB domain-containing protein 3-like n=1 Tax=Tarenaya hassleriana TaxID=28532 RepID=UPI00053C573A|nr:PREDICTED: LOB domain-containing protein 3-like [Tarenaya hassleriana]
MKERGKGPCAGCKLLRRKCVKDCIFAPYFPAEESQKFLTVHKIFGASNVTKMLQELPESQRTDAVSAMAYEANARVRDPVYGCVGAISSLQSQVDSLQAQLALAQAELLQFRLLHHHRPPPPSSVAAVNSPTSKHLSAVNLSCDGGAGDSLWSY